MADSKITALDNLTSADPANDMIPIVDVSATPPASGNTKRISINNILACSPSATLASLNVTGSSMPANGLYLPTTNTLEFAANSLAQYRIAPLGVFSWYDGAGGTRMTLNATGLGVGGSPNERFNVFGTCNTFGDSRFNVAFFDTASATTGTGAGLAFSGYTNGTTAGSTFGQIKGIKENSTAGNTAGALVFSTVANGANPVERLRIDSAGNCGIGVTPSAWQASWKALDISTIASVWGNVNTSIISNNVFFDGALKYKTAIVASYLQQQSKAFQFFQSSDATPVAGGAAAFTQAMTLDASGNLLVGTTSALSAWATRLTLSTDAGTTKWAVGPYADPNNFIISASGSFGVYLNGTSAVSWTGISDERLKDIIEPISNAVAKVGQLRSVIGKFKADETNTRRSFLLAQDVQTVLPEAVDASNPDRLGVAYTDVIPLLVAAIKELTVRVQTLETR